MEPTGALPGHHDVFISYSTHDRNVANAVCARLEETGVRCWLAPRDILPGTSWSRAIIEGLSGAQVMVLIFSGEANRSRHILHEVERAVDRGLVIIPFRIEDVTPTDDLELFISAQHWLNAISPPIEGHLEFLAKTVKQVLHRLGKRPDLIVDNEGAGGGRDSDGRDYDGRGHEGHAPPAPPLQPVAVPTLKEKLVKHRNAAAAAAGLGALLVILLVVSLSRGTRQADAQGAAVAEVGETLEYARLFISQGDYLAADSLFRLARERLDQVAPSGRSASPEIEALRADLEEIHAAALAACGAEQELGGPAAAACPEADQPQAQVPAEMPANVQETLDFAELFIEQGDYLAADSVLAAARQQLDAAFPVGTSDGIEVTALRSIISQTRTEALAACRAERELSGAEPPPCPEGD